MTTKLAKAVESLETALELSRKYLDGPDPKGRELLERSRARLEGDAETTVAVFAGATGSGKSSLLNALVGENVARVAATRPTTSDPFAVSSRDSGALLDWLGVKHRHVSTAMPANLIAVDLPDIDSTEAANRAKAARMISKADALVWVLDPQKYADAVVHEDYLQRLTEHGSVMIVVLNQIDRVDRADLASMVDDVTALVAADGIRTEVYPVSAATGEGIEELRGRLDELASKKKAAAQRLAADIRTQGQAFEQVVVSAGGRRPTDAKLPGFAPVARHVAKAAGGDIVVDAAEASYVRRGRRATGVPLLRWFARMPDPLERLHLGVPKAKAGKDGSTKAIGASSLAASKTVRTAAVGEVRRYVQDASDSLPLRWRRTVLDDANANAQTLLDECDAMIATADLGQTSKPAWWIVVNLLQWLGTLATIVGLVWLVLLHAVDWLKIRLSEPFMVGAFPLPSLLLVCGIVLCLVLWAVSALLVNRGGARLRGRLSEDLSKRIASRAEEGLLVPIQDALKDYARFWEAIEVMENTRV